MATRIAGQLSGEGNSAAFREFAWRFVSIIARALVALGRRPDYEQILKRDQHRCAVREYAQKYFAEHDPSLANHRRVEGKTSGTSSFAMKDRPLRVIGLDMYLTQQRISDPVMEGLRSAVRYDKTYFDKIIGQPATTAGKADHGAYCRAAVS